jgi:hypothetical protein
MSPREYSKKNNPPKSFFILERPQCAPFSAVEIPSSSVGYGSEIAAGIWILSVCYAGTFWFGKENFSNFEFSSIHQQ